MCFVVVHYIVMVYVTKGHYQASIKRTPTIAVFCIYIYQETTYLSSTNIRYNVHVNTYHDRVPTRPGKQEKTWNLILSFPGLEKSLKFTKKKSGKRPGFYQILFFLRISKCTCNLENLKIYSI